MLDLFIEVVEALALILSPVWFGKWMYEAVYGKNAQSERGDSFFGIVGVAVITATLWVLALIMFFAIS